MAVLKVWVFFLKVLRQFRDWMLRVYALKSCYREHEKVKSALLIVLFSCLLVFLFAYFLVCLFSCLLIFLFACLFAFLFA